MFPSAQLAGSKADLCGIELLMAQHTPADAFVFLRDLKTLKNGDTFPVPLSEEDASRRLSFNHDWGVVWGCGPLAELQAHERTRLARELRLRSYLPGLLLAALDDEDRATETEDPASHLAAFRALCEEPGSALDTGCPAQTKSEAELATCLAALSLGDNVHSLAERVLAECWRLNATFLDVALTTARQAPDAAEKVTVLLVKATEVLECFATMLAAPEDLTGPLAGGWLTSLCGFAETSLAPCALLLQALLAKLLGTKAKGKKGKQATAAAAAIAGKEGGPVAAATIACHAVFIRLVESQEVALAAMRDATTSASLAVALEGVAGSTQDCPESLSSKIGALDECRVALLGEIASSRRLSVTRMLPVLRSKLGALKAARAP